MCLLNLQLIALRKTWQSVLRVVLKTYCFLDVSRNGMLNKLLFSKSVFHLDKLNRRAGQSRTVNTISCSLENVYITKEKQLHHHTTTIIISCCCHCHQIFNFCGLLYCSSTVNFHFVTVVNYTRPISQNEAPNYMASLLNQVEQVWNY